MKHYVVVVINGVNVDNSKEGFGGTVRECFETTSELRAREISKHLSNYYQGCEIHLLETKTISVIGSSLVTKKGFNETGELVPL